MAKLSNIEGVGSLLTKLKKMENLPAIKDVLVGYTAEYAVFVHENLEASHKVGQAKFLEEPARKLIPELALEIRKIMSEEKDPTKLGLTIQRALLVAGLRLQRESQELVPVDTGNLKASAFTKLDE